MSEVDRSPARLSGGVAVGVAFVALASSGLYSWVALAAGSVGVLLFVGGVGLGERPWVTTGAFVLFLAAIVAGTRGAPAVPVLVSVAAAVVAWDVGGSAISVGRQLGRDADTTRLEVVHLTASLGVGVLTVGGGYGLYQLGTEDQPVAALVFLLVAAVLLVQALR